MLDVVVGVTAALLVAIGVVIIAGPELPRRATALAALVRQVLEGLFAPPAAAAPSPPKELHPTTLKAISTASELAALLKEQREERLAAELRAAMRKIAIEEGSGLLALHVAARRVRGVHLPDGVAEEQARRLGMRLRNAIADRAEQLELLPFR